MQVGTSYWIIFLKMYANQINILLSQDKLTQQLFTGVFSCDTVPIGSTNCFIIVNTAPSTYKGEHWVLFFKNGATVIFFDSLANDLHFYGACLENAFKKFSNVDSPELSKIRFQSYDSNVCGIYCIYVARELCKNKSINNIQKSFSSNLLENDCKIIKWFRKYLKSSISPNISFKKGQFCCCEDKWKK